MIYTFSWFQRGTIPAPRTFWDWLRRRRPTMYVWRRYSTRVETSESQVGVYGGWDHILADFLLPVVRALHGTPIWGPQIEREPEPGEYIWTTTNLLSFSPSTVHADRGDGEGPA